MMVQDFSWSVLCKKRLSFFLQWNRLPGGKMDANSYHDLVINKLVVLTSKYGFTPVFKDYQRGQFAQASVIFQSGAGRILIAYNQWDQDTYIEFAQGASTSLDYGLNHRLEWLDIRPVLSALEIPNPDNSVLRNLALPDRQLEYWVNMLAPHWSKLILFLSGPEFRSLLADQERNMVHTSVEEVRRSTKRKDLLLILATLLFIGSLYLVTILSLPRQIEQALSCAVLLIFALALFGPPLRSKYLHRYRHSQK